MLWGQILLHIQLYSYPNKQVSLQAARKLETKMFWHVRVGKNFIFLANTSIKQVSQFLLIFKKNCFARRLSKVKHQHQKYPWVPELPSYQSQVAKLRQNRWQCFQYWKCFQYEIDTRLQAKIRIVVRLRVLYSYTVAYTPRCFPTTLLSNVYDTLYSLRADVNWKRTHFRICISSPIGTLFV